MRILASIMVVLSLVGCGGGSGGHVDGGVGPDGAAVGAAQLIAQPGWNKVLLSWTAVTGATTYTIYRSDTAGMRGTAVGAPVTATTFSDTTATLFTPAYYTITATVGAAEGPGSNQAEAFAFDLTHWTIKHTGLGLHDVAFGPAAQTMTGADIYVAVGDAGEILTSVDGVTWTPTPGAPLQTVDGVVFGAGKFVAVGAQLEGSFYNYNIATSPDGVTWTKQAGPFDGPLRDVQVGFDGATGGNVHFMAVGDAGHIAVSTDGVSWTTSACGLMELDTIAVSQNVDAAGLHFAAMIGGVHSLCWSNNGTTWTPIPQLQDYIASAAADTSGNFLMLTASGFVMQLTYAWATQTMVTHLSSSLNNAAPGHTWQGITEFLDLGATQAFYAIDVNGGLYFSIDAGNDFSPTGSTFDLPIAVNVEPHAIVAAGNTLFVPGDSSQLYRSTDNGATFGLAIDADAEFLWSAAYANGKAVALGVAGSVFTSGDGGGAFTESFAALSPLTPVIATSTGFAFATAAPSLVTSTDGASWTATPVPFTLCATCYFDYGQLAEHDGKVVGELPFWQMGAFARTISLTGTPPSLALADAVGIPGYATDLQVEGASFSAAGSSAMWTSTDGVTWTQAEAEPFMNPWTYLDDGTTRYLGDGGGMISHSSDGQTWSAPVAIGTVRQPIRQLVRAGDLLFAVGDLGLIAASTDGESFAPITVPAYGDFHAFIVTDRGFVAVGNHGLVVTAP